MVLFDEVEKAHPDVFNTLLQVLDDGRITDGQGRTVDFRNTVIVMTSNVGSHLILDAAQHGGVSEATKHQVMSMLQKEFRPEFLNRIDDTIVFDALSNEDLRRIVDIQLAGLRARLADRRISLHLTDGAKDHLARIGYDPQFGARPLKRAISREIETPLAREILSGKVQDNSQLLIDFQEGRLQFQGQLVN